MGETLDRNCKGESDTHYTYLIRDHSKREEFATKVSNLVNLDQHQHEIIFIFTLHQRFAIMAFSGCSKQWA